MKNFLVSGRLINLAITAAAICIFTGHAQAQMISSILGRIDKNRLTLSTLRADITMGEYNPGLAETDISKGRIIWIAKSKLLKDDYLRVDFTRPRQEVLTITGAKYTSYLPSLMLAHTGYAVAEKDDAGGVLLFLNLLRPKLWKKYYIMYLGEEKLPGDETFTWHLKIGTKKNSKYKNVEYWVDVNGMVLQIKINPKVGDFTYFRLTNIENSIKLDPKQFELKLPENVKVIRG